MRLRTIGLLGMLVSVGCGDGVLVPPDGYLTLGTWGGEGAGVIATDSVTHVHIGCTFGDIVGRVALDQDGRFTASGNYVPRAYPVQQGPSVPAQFSGRLGAGGRTLTLAVAVNDTVEKRLLSLGPVTVVLNREPELGPCPICSVPRMPPRP